jgi:Transposase
MIDKISARREHRYVTVVLGAESRDLLLLVEGHTAQAVTEFLAAMPAHRAKAEAITEVVMHMSPAYIAGVQAHFSNARIVFDLFPIMKLAGALDAVRKSLRKQGADLTGALWALRGNEWTGSQEQLDLRRKLARAYPILGRALTLSEGPPRSVGRWRLPSIRWWLGWADRRRLDPSANSPALSKNTSTAFWLISKPASRMPPSKPLTLSSKWLSASPVAFATSITSASPLISMPADLTSKFLIPYPLETSKRLVFVRIKTRRTTMDH